MVTPLILQAGECLKTFREKECVCVSICKYIVGGWCGMFDFVAVDNVL